eukprot:m.64233 g.64233  ORF g.64233 m.64233 type:complete len:906 (-) comp8107_c0_seq1:1436-4153(-)
MSEEAGVNVDVDVGEDGRDNDDDNNNYNNASNDDGGKNRPRRRRRGLLKMYYGTSETEATKKKEANPLDINGDNFDEERYFLKLLCEEPLRSLIKKETAMNREVKSLESDMQTLVYENYNKFISATDTIRHMKDKVDSMEEEMEKLQKHMQETAAMSTVINNALRPQREEIRGLVATHTTLQQFQFLFELPTRLQECLDMGMKEQAITYYLKGLRGFEDYKEKESFKNILTSCEGIMTKLHDELSDHLNSPTSTTKEVQEVISLLARLGMDDSLSLADLLLARAGVQWTKDEDMQTLAFEKDMAEFKTEIENLKKSNDDDDDAVNKKNEDGAELSERKGKDHEESDKGEERGEKEDTNGKGPQNAQGENNDDDEEEKKLANDSKPNDEDEDSIDPNKLALFGKTVTSKEKASKGAKKSKKAKLKVEYTPLQHLITNVGKTLFFNFAEWIICYQDVFLCEEKNHRESEIIVDVGDLEEMPTSLSPTDPAIHAALQQRLSERARVLVMDRLLPYMQARFDEYVAWDKSTVTELSYHIEQLLNRVEKLHGVILDAKLIVPVNELAVSTIEQYVAKVSHSLSKRINTTISQCVTSKETSSNDRASVCAYTLCNEIISTFNTCQKVESAKFFNAIPALEGSFFVKSLLEGIVLFGLDTISVSLRLNCTRHYKTMLNAYSICCAFVNTHIPALSKHLQNNCNDNITNVIKSALRTKVNALRNEKKNWLDIFVKSFGSSLCRDSFGIVEKVSRLDSRASSVDNPLHCLSSLVGSVADIYSDLELLFGQGVSGRTSLVNFNSRIQCDGTMNIHRLFSDAIKIYSDVEEDISGVMRVLLLIFLKGLSEVFRQFTFTQASSTTLQIALFHMHRQFAVYVDSDETESSVNALFARAVSVVLARCEEEPPLLNAFQG